MLKVLIADDEAPIKRSLSKIIEMEFPQLQIVFLADDGREALKGWEQHQPDLVISDVRMPEMDGIQLSQEIRSRGMQTEIIIISGYNDYGLLRQAMQNGVSDYLLKPVDPEEVVGTLGKVIERLGDRARQLNGKNRWLSDRKKTLQKLADAIWYLQEEHIETEMSAIRGSLESADYPAPVMTDLIMQAFTLVHAELEQLSDGKLQLMNYKPFQRIAQSLVPFEEIDLLLQHILSDIREMRNWGSHRLIRSAIEFIEGAYHRESLSLTEISDFVGMSTTYFSKCFRQEMGVSCTQYITKLRMQKAVEMLHNPTYKVYEVAYSTGFSDYAHFAKVFKKTFDFSPSEFRANLGIV
ncbi:response regulator [Paenibacillus koleovorans]|uniref:response regulator n=1 Tax=Paenibacillus koleovorans TaxID=121608 RepID=UPI000FD833AD|nr:response regulator [Paenibacillus koleovorans]